ATSVQSCRSRRAGCWLLPPLSRASGSEAEKIHKPRLFGHHCLMSGSTPKRLEQRTLVDVSKVPVGGHQHPAISPNGGLWNIGLLEVSLRLDAGGLDHLGPFLGLVGDELAVIGA